MRSPTAARDGSANGTGAGRRVSGSPRAGSTWSASTPTTTRVSCCPSRSARVSRPPPPSARTTFSRCAPSGAGRQGRDPAGTAAAGPRRQAGAARRHPGRHPGLGKVPGGGRLVTAVGRASGRGHQHRDRLVPGRWGRAVVLRCPGMFGRPGPDRTGRRPGRGGRFRPSGCSGRRGAGRPGRHRPPGRERVRGRAVRHHGPVRRPAVPGGSRAAAGLPVAGVQPGAVRARRGRDPGAGDRHPGQARTDGRRVRRPASRMPRSRPAARGAVAALGSPTSASWPH